MTVPDVARATRWLFASGGSFGARALRGGLWLTVGNVLIRILALARIVILARRLSSHDFGLFGVGLIALAWIERLGAFGVSPALIRQPGDIRPYLDTVWTSRLLRGSALAAFLVAGAPLVAALVGTPDATAVVRTLAAVVLLRGLANPAVVLLSRELDFRRVVAWNLSESAVELVAAVLLSLVLGNVWALVGSVLAGETVRMLMSYRIVPYHPRLRLEGAQLRELGRFGTWVFVHRLARTLAATVDGLLVGRLLGPTALGLYQMAGRFAFPVTHEIGVVVARVMLPGFASGEHLEGPREAFLRVLHLAAAVIVPLGALLAMFGGAAFTAVLGDAWQGSASVLPLLAWCGVARALSSVAVSLFQAAGRPEVPARTSLAGAAVAAGAVYPLTRAFGMTGAAAGVLAGAVLSTTLELWGAFMLLRVRWAEQLRSFRTGVVAALPFLAGALPFLSTPSPLWIVTLAVACALSAALIGGALRPYLRGLTGRAAAMRECARGRGTPTGAA